jgi:hypothetical protein
MVAIIVNANWHLYIIHSGRLCGEITILTGRRDVLLVQLAFLGVVITSLFGCFPGNHIWWLLEITMMVPNSKVTFGDRNFARCDQREGKKKKKNMRQQVNNLIRYKKEKEKVKQSSGNKKYVPKGTPTEFDTSSIRTSLMRANQFVAMYHIPGYGEVSRLEEKVLANTHQISSKSAIKVCSAVTKQSQRQHFLYVLR